MSNIKPTTVWGLGPLSVTDTTTKSDLFSPFFGEMPAGPIRTDPYERQSNQNLALPDAYKGRSNYLGQIIEFQLLTEDDWYTTVMLPIQYSDDIAISWNKWTFDQHRTSVVPEEGPSRLITNRRSERSASMERQGIAFQLEHGFMKTRMGVDNYIYNLRQMAYAVAETNKQDVIMAYLNAKDVYTTWEKRHGHYNNRTLRQRLDMERDNWACAQKDEMGLAKLDAKSDEEMMRVRGRADTWLLPPKMQLFAKFQPHETDYYLSGKAWSYDSKDTFGVLNNKRVYLMRQYDIDAAGMQDITQRERQIGQYYTMVDRYSESRTDSESYTNEERSIIVYDEDADNWKKISLKTPIEKCGLWDEDGNLLPPDGGVDVSHRNIPHPEDAKYDFLTMPESAVNKDARLPIRFVGQISEKNLKTTSLIGLARIAAKTLGLSSTDLDQVAKLLTGLTEANNQALTAAGILDLIETNALKEIDQVDTYIGLIPPGNQYYDFKADANKLTTRKLDTPEYQRFMAAVKVIMGSSIFLDDKWSTPNAAFFGQSGIGGRVVIENLLGGFGLPVWVRKTPGARTDKTLEVMDATNLVTLKGLLPLMQNLVTNKGINAGKIVNVAKALEDLFGFVGDDGKFGGDYSNGPASHQIHDDGKMGGGEATQKKFTLRSRLVSYVQNMIIRVFAGKINDESVDKFAGVVNQMKAKLAIAGKSAEDLWVGMVKGISDDFDGITGAKGSLPDSSQIVKDLEMAPDTAIVVAIGARLGVAEDANAFYITPMVLSLVQLKALVAELTGGSDNAAAIQLKMDKAGVTVSNPAALDQPLVSGADMLALARMLKSDSDLSRDLKWAADDIFATPLGRFLSAQSRKRSAAQRAEGEEEARRRRMARGGKVVDAMDIDGDDDGQGNRIQFPGGIEIPSLTHHRFAKRIRTIESQMVNPIYKFLAKIMAALPITKQNLLTLYNNHINIPMGFLVACPHMRYRMHFAIKTLAGGETGNTYIRDIDFQVSDDTKLKMHLGHLTLYTKAIVRNDENVRVFYDIFSGECLGGAGTKEIDVATYNPRDQQYGEGSLLFMALAYEEKELPNPLDLSGHFTYFDDPSNTDRSKENKRPHYSTARRYNQRFGWRLSEDVSKYTVEQKFHPLIYTPMTDNLPFNTVCYQGEEFYYNRMTRMHDIEHKNTGHWGDFCFPGARKLRDGELKPWSKPAQLVKV